MPGTAALLQAGALGGRRLLQDCDVVGSVGKGGSIAILILIGFVLGGSCSCLFFWWRQRRALRIELEYRSRYGDASKRDLPDVTAMVKAANTPTINRGTTSELAPLGSQLPKAASAMSEGPLAMGAAGSFKHDMLAQALSAKERQHSNPVADMARSSSGNPFAGEVPSFNVLKNDVCSLNNTPSPSTRTGQPSRQNSGDGQQQPGLIGTDVFTPADDPDSPRITKPAPGPPSASPPGDAFAWAGMAAQPAVAAASEHVVESRIDSVVVKDAGAAGNVAAAGMGAAAGAAAAVHSGSDYLAALHSTGTNPFETPALRQEQEQEGTSTKAAHKQELLQQVQGEEYGDDELDPEWQALLSHLDERLQAAGRPRLSTRERAVAIRSLIVATASQSADVALSKAMHDVEAYRRAQSFRAAA